MHAVPVLILSVMQENTKSYLVLFTRVLFTSFFSNCASRVLLTKNWKSFTAEQNFYIFFYQNCNLLIPRPSPKLQENIQYFKTWHFFSFFPLFVGNFCPPRSEHLKLMRIRNPGFSCIYFFFSHRCNARSTCCTLTRCRARAHAILLTNSIPVHVQLLPSAMHVHAVLVPHPDPVVGHIVTNHQPRRTIRTCDTKNKWLFPDPFIFFRER